MSTSTQQSGLHATLAAPERSAEIPAASDVYGWLVGSWRLDVLHYRGQDVSRDGLHGEVHAGWVLEGRAVQDVWIMPERSARRAGQSGDNRMYGTTLRLWDPRIEAWRISWSNPEAHHYEQQIGRRSGADIVQLGTRVDGTPTRWRFTEMTPDSFHWLGEALQPDGSTWRLEGEFLARRVR
jgi:hypothetical protein